MPSYVNYARLQVHPFWKPLRSDPRSEMKIDNLFAERKPRNVYKVVAPSFGDFPCRAPRLVAARILNHDRAIAMGVSAGSAAQPCHPSWI